jgi:hypothetical protein
MLSPTFFPLCTCELSESRILFPSCKIVAANILILMKFEFGELGFYSKCPTSCSTECPDLKGKYCLSLCCVMLSDLVYCYITYTELRTLELQLPSSS